MRFGLRAKIVSIVVAVLAVALLALGSGYREFEVRLLAPTAAPRAPLPAASALSAWFRSHGSWAGADPLLASRAPVGRDLMIVQAGRVRAGSSHDFDGATAAVDDDGKLRITRRASLSDGAAERFDVERPPLATIRERGRSVGTLYELPRLSLIGADLGGANAPWFAKRLTVFAIAVGATAAIIGAVLAGYVVRPIRELTAAARTASRARLPRVPVRSNDEIGELARAFNALGERLARSEAVREGLVDDLSHELRTPLTNVRYALESFEDGVAEPTAESLRSVLADVLLLARLVDDLDALGTSRAGASSLRRVPVDLASVIRSAADAFADRAAERDVRIELSRIAALPLVNLDPARIRQVLQNLLDNALRYGRPGGVVTVELSCETLGVRVAVHDDGDGFAPSDEAAIFERLHRLDASRSRATGGSGLGLSIAKRLVEAHGGSIGANGGAGSGATVWFVLPTGAHDPPTAGSTDA